MHRLHWRAPLRRAAETAHGTQCTRKRRRVTRVPRLNTSCSQRAHKVARCLLVSAACTASEGLLLQSLFTRSGGAQISTAVPQAGAPRRRAARQAMRRRSAPGRVCPTHCSQPSQVPPSPPAVRRERRPPACSVCAILRTTGSSTRPRLWWHQCCHIGPCAPCITLQDAARARRS